MVASLLSEGAAGAQALPKGELMQLVNEYRSVDGFDVVRLGYLGTAGIKSIIRLAAIGNEEGREALKVIRGVNRVVVVDYESCESWLRDEFSMKLRSILCEAEVFMEVKDDGETMKMYGVVDGSGTKVKDFMIYDESGCALICLFGSIRL